MFTLSVAASAEPIRGYTRDDGTHVRGYNRNFVEPYRFNNYGWFSTFGYQSNDGAPRHQYTPPGATNSSTPVYDDNDNDGVTNLLDPTPNGGQ